MIGTPIPDQEKETGRFETPILEQDKNANILPGTEIDVGDWQDNILTSKQPYEPNKGAVGNMGEFLNQPGFGSELKNNARKTNQRYDGQPIYIATGSIKGTNIKQGDKFYLDGKHKNHIEVFTEHRKFKEVYNLDGTPNQEKTEAGKGRRLPK